MCCSRAKPFPVAEISLCMDEDVPEIEEVDNFELELLRSIEEAARENQRLIQTVRHFQEVIEEQTILLEQHIREHTLLDVNNNGEASINLENQQFGIDNEMEIIIRNSILQKMFIDFSIIRIIAFCTT